MAGFHRVTVGPRREPPLPSATRQAAGFVASAGAVIAHAATTGEVMADAETQARRWAICRACPHFRPSDERCGRCGCYLARAIAFAAKKCPVGKW